MVQLTLGPIPALAHANKLYLEYYKLFIHDKYDVLTDFEGYNAPASQKLWLVHVLKIGLAIASVGLNLGLKQAPASAEKIYLEYYKLSIYYKNAGSLTFKDIIGSLWLDHVPKIGPASGWPKSGAETGIGLC